MGRRSRKPGGSKAPDSQFPEQMPNAICYVSVLCCSAGTCGGLKQRWWVMLGHRGERTLETAAPPSSLGRGCLMGRMHAQRLETACSASVNSLYFLRFLMEQLQKCFLASLALQSGRIGLVAMGLVLPSLPTPRPLQKHKQGTTYLHSQSGLWD